MKYLKRFNESLNEDWDLEEIKDIFQDFLDEGFTLDDVSVGSSLTISPKLWCPSHEDFTGNKSFRSLTIKLDSVYAEPKYDFSILDVLDECIKHFESYYRVKLDSIYTVGLPTKRSSYWAGGLQNTMPHRRLYVRETYNWFNSCETIKDISKSHNLTKLTVTKFDLTFDLTKTSNNLLFYQS